MDDHLAASSLFGDQRIQQAKKLIIEAVQEHCQKITNVRPPVPSLKKTYEEALHSLEQKRGMPLWFPFLGSGIGNGPLVELLDGSVKYDFINGIGPHYFGHSHPLMIEACLDSAICDTVMQGHLQQNQDSFELITLLCSLAKMDHCFLSSSGAMANENGLKIVFQKRSPAYRVLAFDHCFAGRTLTLAQITDKPSFREGLPQNVYVDYVPFYDSNHPEESTQNALDTLKRYLVQHPKEYAVMIFELIQGENGFYVGSKEFFTSLMNVLKENNISIFVDEIQTFGRTPSLFAFQYFGLEPYVDIVTIGKLSQVCATLFNHAHQPRPGLLSQTFTSSTSAIRSCQAILHFLVHGNFYGENGKIAQLHHHFIKKLKEIAERHPHFIHGPFGLGGMIAFTPFDGDAKRTKDLVLALFHNGVISFVAGSNPTRIRFLMPVGVVTTKDIDAVCEIIETTMVAMDKKE